MAWWSTGASFLRGYLGYPHILVEHQCRIVRGAQRLAGAGGQHRAEIDHVDVTRQVLVHWCPGVVEAVALVKWRFVDKSVNWIEQGVTKGVAQEAGVAGRGVSLDLDRKYVKIRQTILQYHIQSRLKYLLPWSQVSDARVGGRSGGA